MYRFLLPLSLLLAVGFSTVSLSAAELSLSLGIRQTFSAGDANGDLDINQNDLDLWESHDGEFGSNIAADINRDSFVNSTDEDIIADNQGAATSGVIGSDGGTNGPTASTGSQTLIANGTWQEMTFTLPVDLFSPPSDWGVLDSLLFDNTADGETKYKVWVDDIASTNSGGATIFGDFESNLPGEEVIFQEPSVASGGDILGTPNISEVTNGMAFSGSQSLTSEFEFIDDGSRTAILSTTGVDNLPNPLIQLRDGDYSQVPVDGTVSFSTTTVTFWAKATVVPEPSSAILLLIATGFFWRRQNRP